MSRAEPMAPTPTDATTNTQGGQPPCTLFLSAGTPGSERARRAVLEALDQAGYGESYLEVVDVRAEPQRALKAGAIAVPMLTVRTAHGQRWYAGTFETTTDVAAFFNGLDDTPA